MTRKSKISGFDVCVIKDIVDHRYEAIGTAVDSYSIRILSQSGQIQVGPLDIPHLFSSKQLSQI